MTAKVISIVTEWGDGFGCGHIQRMASAMGLLLNGGYEVFLVHGLKRPDFLPESFQARTVRSVDPQSDLIIRDMRDSTADEIADCRKIAPVLALDDMGKGSSVADHALYLLPHPSRSAEIDKDLERFLYGFTFTDTVKSVTSGRVQKNIDIAIYAEASPDRGLWQRVIPHGAKAVIISGGGCYGYTRGKWALVQNRSYAEILLSSKAFLTHFGISLFEGSIAGCRILTLDPTEYHSSLTGMVKDRMNITDLGILPIADNDYAKSAIVDAITNPACGSVSPSEVYASIMKRHSRFVNYISQIPSLV